MNVTKKKSKAAPRAGKSQSWYKKALKKCAFMLDMKRRNKFITFFALLFVAAYFCMPSMESIVKKVVNKYGSELTGTDVSLSGFDIKLKSGEGIVKGIKIANPKGYKSKNLFYLKEVGVKVDIASLAGDTMIIESIDVENPEISYEMLSLKQNNVSDILNNIKANTSGSEETAAAKAEEAPAAEENRPKEGGKKVIIRNLNIRDGRILVTVGFGSLKKELEVPLPDISMQDIGKEKQGASIAETISDVMSRVLQSVSKAVTDANLNELGGASLEKAKALSISVQDGAGKAVSGLKESGAAAAENTKEAAGKLKDSLGSIFK